MCRLECESDSHTSAKEPASECPFTIRPLNETTWMIRERDPYRETPLIFARICSQKTPLGALVQVLVINDTGVGTTWVNDEVSDGPTICSIKSFIDHHLNPDRSIPYLIILSHCHWDHILGLPFFNSNIEQNEAQVTVLSSSHQKNFLSIYSDLEEHSLCKANQKPTPKFDVGIWADDYQQIVYKHPSGFEMTLPILTIHTPGHTPDSLTWFDIETRTVYVGDSLYQQESDDPQCPLWGRDHGAPVMFTNEASLPDWWKSINKMIDFVQKENTAGQPRVRLASGHITSQADAASCLVNMKKYMGQVLGEEIPFFSQGENRGWEMGHWTLDKDKPNGPWSEFSVGAPVFIIEQGRKMIPRKEWSV